MSRRPRARWLGLLTLLLGLPGLLVAACGRTAAASPESDGPAAPAPAEILVSAAASLQDVLRQAAGVFERSHGVRVRFNSGSSGALAVQIAAGAPVHLFVAAGTQPMEKLVSQGLVDPAGVRPVAGNRLVLIAPKDQPSIRGGADLGGDGVRRLAIGDPAHVPAGQYARQTLTRLGLWTAVQPKLVRDQDVRQVLQHVAAGEAQAGIVYRTDAAATGGVAVVAEAPPGSHDPVIYPMAVVRGARHGEAARRLAGFLLSDTGQRIFRQHGFEPAS